MTLYTFISFHRHTHSGPQRIFVSKVSIIHKFVRQERPWQFIEIDWVCVCVWVSPSHGNVFKTLVSELFKQIHVFIHSDQREFFFAKKRNIKSRNTQNKRCAWYLMWHQGQGKTTMTTTTTWMVTIRTKQCDANTFSRNSRQSHTLNWCECVWVVWMRIDAVIDSWSDQEKQKFQTKRWDTTCTECDTNMDSAFCVRLVC